MPEDLASRLSSAAGAGDGERKTAKKIKQYEDQVLTFVSIKEVDAGKFGPSVIATVLDTEGNEEEVWTTSVSGTQLKEVNDQLPLDLKVVGFDTGYGTRGIKLELA